MVSPPTLLAACVLATAASLTDVAFGYCNTNDLAYFKSQEGDYKRECAGLDATFKLDRVASLTATQLETIATCKETPCLDAFRKLMPAVPDCDVMGTSVKGSYEKMLKMCEMFAAGPVTQPVLVEMFKEFAAASADFSASVNTTTDAEPEATTTEPPATTTPTPTTTTSATTSAPTTVPPTTSGATAATISAALVVATVALAAL